ncbi:hypothetical protein DVH24_019848 [Malus domestica]|uniref:VPS37 C-terminal domain-containing protein n=2 Tax=Malus TaxID=3749 RepID=A0A498I1G9_MALDO|nr:hypothetical protein DVH24_019848 [Malus domestica]
MNTTEEESEALHQQFLDKEGDLGTFVEKYKKLRTTYHKRALVHLAAKTSSIGILGSKVWVMEDQSANSVASTQLVSYSGNPRECDEHTSKSKVKEGRRSKV